MINNSFIKLGLMGLVVMSSQVGAQTTKADKPIAPQSQQEADAVTRSQDGFEIVRNSDGSESVDLKGRFQMYSVAKVVNGKVVYSCHNHDKLPANHSHEPMTQKLEKRGVR